LAPASGTNTARGVVIGSFMYSKPLRDFFGVCVAGAAACAVFAVFVFLVFALSIFQFANYFARGRL
jgi:hypothetical protein